MTRIIIVDDHKMFNDGLKELLNKQTNLEVVGQVFSGDNVSYFINKFNPDLLLLDINLPKKNDLDIAKELVKEYPSLKIIVITMYEDAKIIKTLKKIGADGYLPKNASSNTLITAIDEVIKGGNYFEESLGNLIIELDDKSDIIVLKTLLTPREFEIIKCIRKGMSSKQIADKVNLSYNTVKTHRRNIHFKLKTETTAELIHFAVENNI